jgi:predicted ferric reductase
VALVATWIHLSSKKLVGKVFLQIGILLWAFMTLAHGTVFAFRNLMLGKSLAEAHVSSFPNALQVKVKVPRPWQVKAGQYIFLSIPSAGIMQSHPFMITWWEHNGGGLTVSLLIKPRRGFTGTLTSLTDKSLLAFIDGPYGVDHDFGNYGTVLMFATGIGIAGQLPFIKEIVSGYNNCVVRTHRIILVWRLDKECRLSQLLPV